MVQPRKRIESSQSPYLLAALEPSPKMVRMYYLTPFCAVLDQGQLRAP